MKKVIIDIYGADNGPEPIIKGALQALELYPDIGVILVGNRQIIENFTQESDHIEIIETDDFISNTESPQVVFSGREQSSMVLSFSRLKNDEDCIGMLSAGSTGALLIGSIRHLGLIKGLRTPALSSYLPLFNGNMVCLIDCGANIACTPYDLVRFALMGNAFKECMCPEKKPRVALLSVGKEEGKGNELTLKTYPLLKELPINFIGNMEGSDFVTGYADVVVCDGFAGNIVLKCAESAGLVAKGVVSEIAKRQGKENDELVKAIENYLTLTFDYNSRGGATFLGTEKTLIKMHGCAVENTVVACIDQLLRLEKANFRQKIKTALN